MSFLLFAISGLHSWWVLPDDETVNLWYDCLYDNTTQSWMCASVADSRISVFTAALIYAIHVGKFHLHRQPGGSFGYCFVLAWLAFPLALLSGVMYIHLRKRE
ncbi:HNRPLL protein [Platysternon megacephalum]|uniref:HNRPLL protein n=1 Tax=Platysternon megacephalum TaxID=55544 RepID=A0A4D9DIJ9_9SAUR|nr:HNRPLL protein [Platysternon megacephalum]